MCSSDLLAYSGHRCVLAWLLACVAGVAAIVISDRSPFRVPGVNACRSDMLDHVSWAFVALGAIAFLMRMLRSMSFLPFVIYRVILGGALLGLIWSGIQLGTVN